MTDSVGTGRVAGDQSTGDQRNGVLSSRHRSLTLGVILATTAIAFEGLGVTTVAPSIADDLVGLDLYAWIFSAYFLAQIVGSIAAGRQVDRHGPATPFTLALIVFAAGLIVASVAPDMPVLIAGRVLQGLGAGILYNCIYASVSLGYPDALRPRVLAAISSAYVLPALIGPTIAALVAEAWSWRVVFWGIAPLLLPAAALTLPAFRRLGGGGRSSRQDTLIPALRLTCGTGLVLAGLERLPGWIGPPLVALGLLIGVPALQRLLPSGTFVARPGLPAALASRGLFAAGYFSAETFVVLVLIELRGYSTTVAGLMVTIGSLTWALGAWLQARLDERDDRRDRRARIIAGVSGMVLGTGLLTAITWTESLALLLAAVGHLVLGLGMGLAHPTSSAVAFAEARLGEEGAVAAGLQLAELLAPAVVIGLGGAFMAIGASQGWAAASGVGLALGLSALTTAIGLLAACRLPAGDSNGPKTEAVPDLERHPTGS